MSRKMVLKNTRSRSHFWLKNLCVQPLFVFWDPATGIFCYILKFINNRMNSRSIWMESMMYLLVSFS